MEAELARVAQIIAAIMFITMGTSHLLQPKAWVDFFVFLRNQGSVGVFANSFLSLFFGGIIVALHNIWTWPAIILTLIGWAQVLKAVVGFVAPALALRGLALVSHENAWRFIAAGVPSFALGLWFLFDAVGR
jgi:hypothetical protein